MHNLVVSCLAVAYLSANVYAIVKMRVFELARSRKHLLLYGVPFILWGSLILLGCKLMEIMRERANSNTRIFTMAYTFAER